MRPARVAHGRQRGRALGPAVAGVLAASVAWLVGPGCRRPAPAPQPSAAAEPDALSEGRALYEQGQLDAALARLQEAPGDPDSLYYQGLAWTKKAEAAPAPTPPPPPSPAPRGAPPPAAPEFKPEELEALRAFQEAIAARPDHARAHMGLGALLEPHALRRQAAEVARKARPPRGRGRVPEPTPVPSEVDTSPERVLGEYRAAARGDTSWKEPLQATIRFALAVDRPEDADSAYRQLLERDKENPDLLVGYGDFLLERRGDRQGAMARYREALFWRADDPAAKNKIGEVYLAMGIENFEARQYAVAEERLREAKKWITDPAATRRLAEYMEKLAEIRRR